MPRFPDFLERFRRLVTPPGRPAEALGVPTAGEELEAELRPLFAELDGIEAEAEAIRAEARRGASRRLDAAAEEAAAVVAEARERAAGERARASARRLQDARRAGEVDAASGRREAERIRERGRQRIPDLVEELIACVRRAES